MLKKSNNYTISDLDCTKGSTPGIPVNKGLKRTNTNTSYPDISSSFKGKNQIIGPIPWNKDQNT